jgi:hypothetical protein
MSVRKINRIHHRDAEDTEEKAKRRRIYYRDSRGKAEFMTIVKVAIRHSRFSHPAGGSGLYIPPFRKGGQGGFAFQGDVESRDKVIPCGRPG